MPHIRFRSVDSQTVAKASLELPSLLANSMQTSPDNFTFEKLESSFFENGNSTASYPFIEVWWFQRSQEVQDLAAQQITEVIQALTNAQDVVVTFYSIAQESYYENGKHF